MDELPPENHGHPSQITLADFISHPFLQEPSKNSSFHKHSSRVKNAKKAASFQAIGNPLKSCLRSRKKLPSIPEEDLLKSVAVVQKEVGSKKGNLNVETHTPTKLAAQTDMVGQQNECEVNFSYPPACDELLSDMEVSAEMGRAVEAVPHLFVVETESEATMEDAEQKSLRGGPDVRPGGIGGSLPDGVSELVTAELSPTATLKMIESQQVQLVRTVEQVGAGAQVSSFREQEVQKFESKVVDFPNLSPTPASSDLRIPRSTSSAEIEKETILERQEAGQHQREDSPATKPGGNVEYTLDIRSPAKSASAHIRQGGKIPFVKFSDCSSKGVQLANEGVQPLWPPLTGVLAKGNASPAPTGTQILHLQAPKSGFDLHFPPLGTDQLSHLGEKGGSNPVTSLTSQATDPKINSPTYLEAAIPPGDPETTLRNGKKGSHPAWQQGASNGIENEGKSGWSHALGQQTPGPVAFNPEKIKKLGIIGKSEGISSISFTKSDTEFLTERLGHAIVGKFSHSIPSSHHIQKALGNVKFTGPFSWKHLNAKHVLIQFRDLADYARMLSGPNGAPVWYVDSHPMRVFKWTPDFDPFFESPIAAIWCNLIGLPIHLYEPSALFAIGSILGKPIQADHATATQSRLSFARICVEIDISVPPTEEIMVDILGKGVRQKVTWDRIPLYCRDCKHVGHTSDTCYAFGKRATPPKKDYAMTGAHHHSSSNTRPTYGIWRPRSSKEAMVTSNAFATLAEKDEHEIAKQGDSNEVESLEMVHSSNPKRVNVDDDGFQQVRRRRGRHSQHTPPSGQPGSAEDVTSMIPSVEERKEDGPRPFVGLSGGWGYLQDKEEESHIQSAKEIAKPRYYRQLNNGDFDTEEFDHEVDMEETDLGGQATALPPEPT